jgi:hypothetical protein
MSFNQCMQAVVTGAFMALGVLIVFDPIQDESTKNGRSAS